MATLTIQAQGVNRRMFGNPDLIGRIGLPAGSELLHLLQDCLIVLQAETANVRYLLHAVVTAPSIRWDAQSDPYKSHPAVADCWLLS